MTDETMPAQKSDNKNKFFSYVPRNAFSTAMVLISTLGGCKENQPPADPYPFLRQIHLQEPTNITSFRRTGSTNNILIAENQMLVYFDPSSTPQQVQSTNSWLLGQRIIQVGQVPQSYLYQYQVPHSTDLNPVLDHVNAMAGVHFALPNLVLTPQRDPNPNVGAISSDGFYWIDKINARAAWDITIGSESIPIGIVDDAVDSNNLQLQGKVVRYFARCALNGDRDKVYFTYVADPNSTDSGSSECNTLDVGEYHGTRVAAIAAARGDDGNRLNAVGVAWNSPIVSVDLYGGDLIRRILMGSQSPTTKSTLAALDAGIQVAINVGARVINVSQGFNTGEYSQQDRYNFRFALVNAMKSAEERDALVVFAAGNAGFRNDDQLFPLERSVASHIRYYSHAIFVGATDSNDCIANFSDGGRIVPLYAPGVGVYQLPQARSSIFGSGTSYSAPLVAGAAALVWSVNPNLSAEQVKRILIDNARSATVTSCAVESRSVPILDVAAAVRAAQQNNTDAAVQSDAAIVDASSRYDFGYGSFDNIIRTSDGGFILSGSSIPDPSHPNVGGFLKVVKLDSSRNVVYVRSINLNDPMFSSHSLLTANQIVETNDGGLLVGVTAEFLKIFKLNRSGEVVWSFGGTPNMTRLDDNRYFFTNGGNTSSQYFRVFNHIDGAYSAFYWLDTAYPTADSLVPALRSRYGSSLFPSSGYLPTFWTNDFSTLYYYNYLSTTETPDAGPSVSSVYIGFARYDPHPLLPAESIQRLHNPSVVNVIELISTSAAINPRPESIPISDGFLFSLQTGTGSEQRRTMVKLGLNGEVAWRGTFNLSGAYITSTEDDRGNIIFLFRQTSGLVTLSKIDHSGNVVFSRELPSEIGGISSIIAAPDGYLLAGNLTGSAGLPSRPIVVHLDAAGNVSD